MRRSLFGSLAASMLLILTGSLFVVGHTQTLPAPTVDRIGFPAGYSAS